MPMIKPEGANKGYPLGIPSFALGGEFGLQRREKRKRAQAEENDLMKYINSFLSYEYPQGEVGRQIGTMGQQISAERMAAMRGMSERYAAQTGGRLGSTERGYSELGGQYALARAVGSAQIMKAALDRQFEMRMAGLQAYINKYGIDKNVQLAMQQLKMQREQAESGLLGDIFGSIVGGLFTLGSKK